MSYVDDAVDRATRLCQLEEENRMAGARPHPAIERVRAAVAPLIREPDPYLELRDALDALDQLPDPEHRPLLNGWAPIAVMPEREDVVRDAMVGTVRRVLMLQPFCGSYAAADHGFILSEGYAMRVTIAEGTTRAEAIRGMRQMTEYVERHWDALIDEDPTNRKRPSGIRQLERRLEAERKAAHFRRQDDDDHAPPMSELLERLTRNYAAHDDGDASEASEPSPIDRLIAVWAAQENSGSPIGSDTPSPASKASVERSTAAA